MEMDSPLFYLMLKCVYYNRDEKLQSVSGFVSLYVFSLDYPDMVVISLRLRAVAVWQTYQQKNFLFSPNLESLSVSLLS